MNIMFMFIKYSHRPTDTLTIIFHVTWDFTNIAPSIIFFYVLLLIKSLLDLKTTGYMKQDRDIS